MAVTSPVLVVFCEEYARGSFVVQALVSAGYVVRWVRGIETAFLLAERERVDGLVADARSDDVLSPLVTGWRRRAPGAPVVLLARANDAGSGMLSDAVVSSPLSVQSIEAAVSGALGERSRA